ncbi:MAG TPA: NADH-quinone oxidoreductase subunit M, partial [Desulfatiglandales bacterium]|nr:NADH-quinone oxidoreductase subunit M [Desulfatiglandales bacterium]
MAHNFPWLTIILFLPVVGGLPALFFASRPTLCRYTSLVTAVLNLLLVVTLFALGLQVEAWPNGNWLLAEDLPWIESLGIRYSLGLDGISLMLILLTAFLTVLCILVSWKEIQTKVGGFHFFLLLMETSMIGVFLATDLFLFYLFWEVQILPMFFLIGIWGHEERVYATVKFILFTLAGSLFMLIALIGLYLVHGAQTGQYTFSLYLLYQTSLGRSTELWLFAAFLLAFAIKIPVFPFHTWLPDAHTQAPTAGSVILAGLLLKTGAYALLRFGFPLFPAAARSSVPLLLVLGLIGLFYAGWIAFAQKDLKRLVAYSSIGHMGIIVIGIAAWNTLTLSGATLQMINHGLTTSALFILVGMLDERVHSRQLADLGGLWNKMPVFSGFFLFFGMASLGLPGLNNFVGEFLVLVGTVKKMPTVTWLGFAGLFFAVVYILRAVQRTLFEETRGERLRGQVLWDITPREALILAPLTIAVLWIGFHPQSILNLFAGPVEGLT